MNSSTANKVRVYVYVTPEQKNLIDDEAKRQGKTRSVLIADAAVRYVRAPLASASVPTGRLVLDECVTDIARRYSGIPRAQVVGMVAAVICKLAAM